MQSRIRRFVVENEAQLIQQAKMGDQAAFNQLLGSYRGYLQRYLLTLHSDVDAVDDIIQETFLKVFLAIGQYRNCGTFKGWIKTIASNTWKNYLRDQHLDRYELCGGLNDLQHPPEESTEEKILCCEATQRVQNAMGRLPRQQRVTVQLRINEQLSFVEIAKRLQCSNSTVKTNHYVGIKSIQARLAA